MSIIHVNQVKSRVAQLFGAVIDLSDALNAPADQQEVLRLTRGLAAYGILFLEAVDANVAAAAVVDGGDDNGIDAIYYAESTKTLYLVQSKWIQSGIGEPASGDIKKFADGVRDLINMRFERFNAKVRALQPDINRALADPATRYQLVVAHTGANALAIHSRRSLDDLLDEMNDTSEDVGWADVRVRPAPGIGRDHLAQVRPTRARGASPRAPGRCDSAGAGSARCTGPRRNSSRTTPATDAICVLEICSPAAPSRVRSASPAVACSS